MFAKMGPHPVEIAQRPRAELGPKAADIDRILSDLVASLSEHGQA